MTARSRKEVVERAGALFGYMTGAALLAQHDAAFHHQPRAAVPAEVKFFPHGRCGIAAAVLDFDRDGLRIGTEP
jgi:hypothetical protein